MERSPLRTTVTRFVRVLTLPLRAANATVGGQAVMHGVMMRSPGYWGVAVRRYSGEITAEVHPHGSIAQRHRWARIPLVRGVVSLGEATVTGMRALNVSTRYAMEWDEAGSSDKAGESSAPQLTVVPDPVTGVTPVPDLVETGPDDSDASEIPGWQLALMMIVAFGFMIALFKVGPALLVGHFDHRNSSVSFSIIEGLVRTAVLIAYLGLVGLLPDMKSLFQYHSAEHKAINAWEGGVPLEPELVNAQSRIHVRCGTAFLLWVMVVAIAVYAVFGAIVGHLTLWELALSRIVLLAPISGLAFELIKFAGRYPRNRVLRTVLAPGLWLQRLTTRECTPEHCEVAIRSLREVLDREYPSATPQEALAQAGDPDQPVHVIA